MSERYDEARALRVMVEELRAEAPPALDWDALEQRMWTAIDQRENARRHRTEPRSSLGQVLGFAAAAAVLALGVGTVAGSGRIPVAEGPPARAVDVATARLAPGEAGARGERDLHALARGDVIEAKDAPVTFRGEGVVTWTLEPGGRVRVRDMGVSGVGHTVALERGVIRAEVTPRDPAEGLVESFAVEVDQTRVAVHGTSFTVAREAAHVVVDVEHGAIAVGPVGHRGVTTGHLLVGPSRASFSLDGGRTARLLPRESVTWVAGASVTRVAGAPAPAPGGQEARGAVAEAPAHAAVEPAPAPASRPSAPSHAHVEKSAAHEALAPAPAPTLTVAGVRAHVSQCMKGVYADAPPSLQVASTLRLVLEDGKVKSARFDPPLKPEAQGCASVVFGGRFAEGASTLEIPVTYGR